MKQLKLFLGLTISFFLFMTSCTDDIETADAKPELTIDEIIQKGYEEYKAQFPNPVIEYTTLEELNKAYVEAGIEPLTEDDFSPEEWAQLQDPELLAKPRCTSGIAVYIGDWNGNGTFSTLDKVLAQQTIQGIPPGTGFEPLVWNAPSHVQKFGYFDYTYRGYPLAPNPYDAWTLDIARDLDVATKVLLGIYPC